MKHVLHVLALSGVLAIFLSTTVAAQTGITINRIDATGFPVVTAEITVRDDDGNSIRNFDIGAGEVTLSENGIPRTIQSIDCPPRTAESPICAILVSDKSQSMDYPYDPSDLTKRKIDLVKLGASTFLSTVNFTPPTRVAITAFDNAAYLFHPFDDDELSLQSAVQDLQPADFYGTNYEAAFMDPTVGAIRLIKDCPARDDMKRIIVFLTDGQCEVFGRDPEDCFVAQPVIDSALKYQTEVYVIGLGENAFLSDSLKRVADETGGKWFDRKITEEDIRAAYREIAETAQGLEPCTITWESDYGCGEDSRNRDVVATYIPEGYTFEDRYNSGAESVARFAVSPTVISYGNPAVGLPVLRQIDVQFENTSFTLNGLSLGPPDPGFFRITRLILNGGDVDPDNDLPISIRPEDDLKIEVEFTQADSKDFRLAEVLFDVGPCDLPKVVVWGGGAPDNSSFARILPDNGTFSSCDSVELSWVVTPQGRPVVLSYSTDGGNTFSEIVDDATGGSYQWVPPGTGNQFRVRVEALGDFADWDWAEGEGGPSGIDSAMAIDVDVNGNAVVVGKYTGTATFGTTPLTNGGHFVARYDSDGGLLWARQNRAIIFGEELSGNQVLDVVDVATHIDGFSYVLGSETIVRRNPLNGNGNPNRGRRVTNPDDKPARFCCVAVDNTGLAYVAGFGVSTVDNSKTMFINRYDTDLGVQWSFRDGTGISIDNATVTNIAVDINNDIIVTGEVEANTNFGAFPVTQGNYIAKFRSSDRSVVWAYPISGRRSLGTNLDNDIAVDADRNIYLTGLYRSSSLQFGDIELQTVGNGDYYVVKFDPDGTAQWAARATSLPTSTREEGVGIDVDLNGSVYVTGTFAGDEVTFEHQDGTFGRELINPNSGSQNKVEVFTVKYDTDGAVQWVIGGGGNRDDLVSGIAVDRNGMAYLAGVIAEGFNAGLGDAQFGNSTVVNTGQGDVFVAKVRGYPSASDVSDEDFTIVAPITSTQNDPIDVGQAPRNQPVTFNAQFELLNIGQVPLAIIDHEIIGTPGEFTTDLPDLTLNPDANPLTIPPNGSSSFAVIFTPSDIGARSATLRIIGECAEVYEVQLTGEGLDPCEATVKEEVTLEPAEIDSPKNYQIEDIFCNTTDSPITITIDFSGAGATFYGPPPAPVELQPDDCFDLDLVFTPTQIDIPDLIITYGVGFCPYVTVVHASGLSGTATIQAADPAPIELVCPGGVTTPITVPIRNAGGTELRIDNVTVDPADAGFSVVNFPASVATGETEDINVSFSYTPADYGVDKVVSLRIESNADNTDDVITLRARVDTVWFEFVPPTLDFGANAGTALPVTRQVTVINRGTTAADVTNQTIPPGPFSIVNTQRVLLQPNDQFLLDIQFDDPGSDQLQTSTMSLEYTPVCDAGELAISGIRADAGATITLPADAVADVHDKNYAIPVRLTPGTNYSVLEPASRTFTLTMRVDPTVFLPTGLSGGDCDGCTISDNSIMPDASNIDKRTVVIQGTAPAGTDNGPEVLLVNIVGDALLGNVEVSPLELEVAWNGVGVTPVDGQLSLDGICYEGGDRLLEGRNGAFGIVAITPNPAGGRVEISLAAVEIGAHAVEIYNVQGQLVYRYEWFHTVEAVQTAGASSLFSLPVSTGRFSNGVYQVLLKTPTQAASEQLIIAK